MPQPPKRVLTQRERDAEATKLEEMKRIKNKETKEQEKKMKELKDKHLAEKLAGKKNVQAPRQAARIEVEAFNNWVVTDPQRNQPRYNGHQLVSNIKFLH
jgi:hypothetical protein